MQKTSPSRDHLLSVSGLLLDDKVKAMTESSASSPSSSFSMEEVRDENGTATATKLTPSVKEISAEELEDLVTSQSLSNAASLNAGSRVLFATDEWFATADNLLLDSPPKFVPDLYCPQGKVMDGWETRRKRVAGHDWAVIRLSSPLDKIYAVELDSAHFTGNHSPRVSIEVACIDDAESESESDWMPGAKARLTRGGGVQGTGRSPSEVDRAENACRAAAQWITVLPQTPLRPGYEESSMHRFLLPEDVRAATKSATHVRINYYPDGGVARLRVWGKPVTMNDTISLPRNVSATSVAANSVYGQPSSDGKEAASASAASSTPPSPPAPLDITSTWVAYSSLVYPHPELSSAKLGGAGLACSNKHYGVPQNLIQPSYGKDMGDGWETARHPGRPPVWAKDPNTGLMDSPLMDWAVLKLGKAATLGVSRIILDTKHFRGNFPESVKVEGCCSPSNSEEDDAAVCDPAYSEWFSLLPRTRMGPDAEHVFERSNGAVVNGDQPVTHVRVTIFPDGGLSRVRIYGDPSTSDLQSHL